MQHIPSPNFNERKDGKTPRYIILHYTETTPLEESLKYLLGQKGKEVSAHYLLDTDGSAIQLVEEKMRAWHAGTSYWAGEADMNSASIGIEIQNTGKEPFPAAQIEALIQLCKELMGRWDIPAAHVIAHSDIAPDRKEDPGHLFPWATLAAHGIGLWPEVNDEDREIAKALVEDDESITQLLGQIGYAPVGAFNGALTLAHNITAFQRHWEPEVFTQEEAENIGKASLNTVALLLALARHYQK